MKVQCCPQNENSFYSTTHCLPVVDIAGGGCVGCVGVCGVGWGGNWLWWGWGVLVAVGVGGEGGGGW